MNSLAKKVTIIQVLIVSISMVTFISYISIYLSNYINNQDRK